MLIQAFNNQTAVNYMRTLTLKADASVLIIVGKSLRTKKKQKAETRTLEVIRTARLEDRKEYKAERESITHFWSSKVHMIYLQP